MDESFKWRSGPSRFMDLAYEYEGLRYSTREGVYPVEEDTLLLIRSVSGILERGMNVIDMGCGTGLLSLFSMSSGCNVISIDREPRSLSITRSNLEMNGFKGNMFISDLFEGIPHRYHAWSDLITFNPPYLPDDGGPFDRRIDLPLIGGEKGYEITRSFLENAHRFLNVNGKVILLVYPDWSISNFSTNGEFSIEKVIDSKDMNGEVLRSLLLAKRP